MTILTNMTLVVSGYQKENVTNLVIFNSYNRKFIDADDDEDIGLGKEIKFFNVF